MRKKSLQHISFSCCNIQDHYKSKKTQLAREIKSATSFGIQDEHTPILKYNFEKKWQEF
jgi:hypothetical protein